MLDMVQDLPGWLWNATRLSASCQLPSGAFFSLFLVGVGSPLKSTNPEKKRENKQHIFFVPARILGI